MNHLIIYSHPNSKSFNCAIRETLKDALEQKGHEVRVRDLYAIGFDPVLSAKDFEVLEKGGVLDDVKVEQDHVRWADVVTFVFPVWWNSLPAIARGYIDRVFSVGFAYTEKMEGLLPEKKVLVICTLNAPKDVSEKTGAFKAMDFTIGQSLADFCGMAFLKQKYFNSVASVSDQERKDMLKEVEQLAGEID
ncbi:MAG: NAD(P)H-dependent oxidoreductase [Candidatus Aceula meridiana]|nr:NAD(P)H-dependent oxidoreductase [Candidatus Aceula meridiana]